MPTGSSKGENSTRASTSHSVTKPAPPSAEATSSGSASCPVKRRTACGTISPTKPNSPAKLTAAPASAAARTSSTQRTAPTDRPRLRATSSPSDRTFICCESDKTSTSANAITAAAGASRAIVTPVKPPMRKSDTPPSASGTTVTTASIPALNRPETATPASTTFMREAPVLFESPMTRSAAATAPRKAASGAYFCAVGTAAHKSATASPAPELTPMTPDEASGLSSTFWMTTPATASAAPASSAAQVRGRRVYSTIRAAAEVVSRPSSAEKIS